MSAEVGLRQFTHLNCVNPSESHSPIEELYNGTLERCGRCGLVATHIQPSFAYDENYFVTEEFGGYEFDSSFSQTVDAQRFDAELEGLEAQGLLGSVLDVGCATGTFLQRAINSGWRCSGVEIADYARDRVQAELEIPVAASLADLPPGARYDVVTLHHVLEHIHEPLGFLSDEVRPRVGKRLLIEVPNFASLGSRVHGPSWRDLRPDQHVIHYTPETLGRLVEQAGFKVHRIYTLPEPLWSLHGALYTIGLLPGLVFAPNHEGKQPLNGQTAGTSDISDYRDPSGVKRAVTEFSRVLMSPVVGAIRKADLSERLVAEVGV